MMVHSEKSSLALALCIAIDKVAEYREEDIGAMEILRAIEMIRFDVTEALINGHRQEA